jgi:hypothetical protein
MNYYREKYYEYLNHKFYYIELLDKCSPKLHPVAFSNICIKLTSCQVKLEFCDRMAIEMHMKQITFKPRLKLTA